MDACRISHGSCKGSASLLSLFLLCLNHPRVQASETGRSVFFHTKPAPLLLKRNALLRFERLHNLTASIPGLNASTAPCTLAPPLDRKSFALSTSYVFLPPSATGTPTICSAACSSVSPVGLNAQQLCLDTVLVKLLVFVRNGAKVFVFHAVGIDARQLALGLVLKTLQRWRKGFLPVGCAICTTRRPDTHFSGEHLAILLHESFRHTLLATVCKSIVNTRSQTTSSTSCFSSTICGVGKSSREANSTTRNDKALLRLHDTVELAIPHTGATKEKNCTCLIQMRFYLGSGWVTRARLEAKCPRRRFFFAVPKQL